jgi:hypothetical protein
MSPLLYPRIRTAESHSLVYLGYLRNACTQHYVVSWDHTRNCVDVQPGREKLQPYATWTLWNIEFVVAR